MLTWTVLIHIAHRRYSTLSGYSENITSRSATSRKTGLLRWYSVRLCSFDRNRCHCYRSLLFGQRTRSPDHPQIGGFNYTEAIGMWENAIMWVVRTMCSSAVLTPPSHVPQVYSCGYFSEQLYAPEQVSVQSYTYYAEFFRRRQLQMHILSQE